MKLLLFFGLLLVLTFSCDPKWDTRLQIYNGSSFPMFFFESDDYPDTLNSNFTFCTSNINDMRYLIPGEKTGINTAHGDTWENRIKDTPEQTIMFFAYQADSASKYIDKYGCDSLAKRKDLILKRFDVTVDYLNKNNWTLTYP